MNISDEDLAKLVCEEQDMEWPPHEDDQEYYLQNIRATLAVFHKLDMLK